MGKSLITITTTIALSLIGLLIAVPTTSALADTGGTFGIDVSTPQQGLNFTQAKQEGAQFAIVKMGGQNVTPEYVAPDYAQQIDQARSAGLDIGHYYVPGSGSTPKEQADFMADHLHNFDKNHDVLALDDEVLDSNGTLWTDANATQFFTELIQRTGISANQLWFYIDASNAHSHGPWTQVTNLGVRIWWASYGDGTTGHTPTEQPELNGSFPKWDIHQFSSKSIIAGQTVDGDYTTEPLTQLF
jgi:GH25 family lysozyme M1 (1,4-beta-N-acetylmuramidase)